MMRINTFGGDVRRFTSVHAVVREGKKQGPPPHHWRFAIHRRYGSLYLPYARVYSCFQKGSRNVLFFLLLSAFRRLNVAEKKWVNPTHLMYLFHRSYPIYAPTTCLQQEPTVYPPLQVSVERWDQTGQSPASNW